MSPAPPARAANPADAAASFTEAPACRAVGKGWRPLFGNFRPLGFSFEWHDFTRPEELDWGQSFHPGSVELCLNLEGQATLHDGRDSVEVRPRTSVFYVQGEPPLVAKRRAGEAHRFITVSRSRSARRSAAVRVCIRSRPCPPGTRGAFLDPTDREWRSELGGSCAGLPTK